MSGAADERRDRVAHRLIVVDTAVRRRTRGRRAAGPHAAGAAQLLQVDAPAVRRERGREVALHSEQRRLLVLLERARDEIEQRVAIWLARVVAALGGVGQVRDEDGDVALRDLA